MIRQSISAIIASLISMGFVFILLIIGADAGWRLYSNWVPVEYWMEVKSIHIEDSHDGKCPEMKVVRTVHFPFDGKWRVERERKIGEFYVFRTSASGENSYTPDTQLPDPLDLGWWTNYTMCTPDGKILIGKGVHRVNTTWLVEVDSYPPKRLPIDSNDFTVH